MKKKINRRLRAMVQGDAVDSRFFKRHFFATVLVVMGCMAFIAQRFDYATTAGTIRSLEQQIQQAQTHKQRELSRYHTLTRESAMSALADSLNLGLDIPAADPTARPGLLTYD